MFACTDTQYLFPGLSLAAVGSGITKSPVSRPADGTTAGAEYFNDPGRPPELRKKPTVTELAGPGPL